MAITLQDIVDDMAAVTTKVDMLGPFIAGLRAQIGAIGGLTAEQQAQVTAIFDGLERNKAAIAAAMEPVVVVPPPPVT